MPPTYVQGDSPPALINPGSGSTGSGSGGGGGSNSVIVGGVIGGAVILAIIAVLAVFLRRRKVRRRNHLSEDEHDARQSRKGKPYHLPQNFPPPPPPKFSGGFPVLGISKSSFTYADLEQATNGFSRANVVGEGGFGFVFKGVLPDGKVVAVKQLKVGSGQGEREFQAEVEIISRVHHRHLVSLVGYCIADSQRMLVYEFVPNGTLDCHLHGKGRPVMDWVTRLKIAIGAARGLAYLHEDCHPRIIHRDIKSSNILLDYQFEALVSDFGLAKFASDAHTHVTTRVMGTFGYLAFEYASTGQLTEKSDVYSFGVVLLELVTGRKAIDLFEPSGDEGLVGWSRPLLTKALEDGIMEGLIDPKLEKNYNEKEVRRMMEAAAACVRHSAHKRPKLGQVVRALEGDAADLYQGTRPGDSSKYDSSFGSVDYDSAQYKSDLKKLKKSALAGSQEYGSEYSGTTSDYGVNQSVSSSDSQSSKEIERSPIIVGKEDIIARGDATDTLYVLARGLRGWLGNRLRKRGSRLRNRFSIIFERRSNPYVESRYIPTLKKLS